MEKISSENTDPAVKQEDMAGQPDCRELDIEASMDNLQEVLSFVEDVLEKAGCPGKTRRQVILAAEEIFVNIAQYAYVQKTGRARVRLEFTRDPLAVSLTFADRGVPFNPLDRNDPDVTLPADRRPIGGLGIFMTRKLMDEVSYLYRNGENILQMKKKL